MREVLVGTDTDHDEVEYCKLCLGNLLRKDYSSILSLLTYIKPLVTDEGFIVNGQRLAQVFEGLGRTCCVNDEASSCKLL